MSTADKRIDAPAGEGNRRFAHVFHALLHKDIAVRRKLQGKALAHVEPRIVRLCQAYAVRQQFVLNRCIVGIIGQIALRRAPEPVAAVNHPALRRTQPVGQILRLFIKKVLHSRAGQMQNPDAKIQSAYRLGPSVRHPQNTPIFRICAKLVQNVHFPAPFLLRPQHRRRRTPGASGLLTAGRTHTGMPPPSGASLVISSFSWESDPAPRRPK